MGGDVVQPDFAETLRRGSHGDRTEQVGGAGFDAVRQIIPDDVVEGDGTHRAAAAVVGIGAEQAAIGDQRSRSEGGIHLVRRHGDDVEVARVARAVACRSADVPASWAASTRIRPPTAWTLAANRWIGGVMPVTLEAPVTASRATRPP